jgi:cell division protein ZapD
MQTPATIYEHPLNERLRFFLRLEFLFGQARHNMHGEAVWDSHNTLTTLLEILNIVSRIDIKTEVIKELDRVSGTLSALTETPDINHETLGQLLATLSEFKSQLHSMEGPLAQELRENEFFKLVMQRGGIPGGLCDFDLPQYRHWLKSTPENRIENLTYWLSTLDSLRLSIELMLKLTRESANPTPQIAEHGNYQQTLETSTPYQMIRVWLPAQSPYFVEVSAGRHRLTTRFMEASTTTRPTQTTDNVDFHLSCCAL